MEKDGLDMCPKAPPEYHAWNRSDQHFDGYMGQVSKFSMYRTVVESDI